jgi:hypothetical protein
MVVAEGGCDQCGQAGSLAAARWSLRDDDAKAGEREAKVDHSRIGACWDDSCDDRCGGREGSWSAWLFRVKAASANETALLTARANPYLVGWCVIGRPIGGAATRLGG